MNIDIDGKKFNFNQGESILQVAEKNGIYIPKLCYDDRFKPYTSCFLCIVRDKNRNKIIPSCSSKAIDGMIIITEDEEIIKLRKMALELLLSEHDADCFSPCKTKCPANLDVRDYIMYARTSNNFEGFLSIRRRNPFIATTGRVCPAFCEEVCTRVDIDEKVDIRLLKRYLADNVYKEHDKELFEHETNQIRKGKTKVKIAIVGGGPAGLSSAYYFRLAGYKVKIYDKNKELGGMLRYSIPSYRLPVSDLNQEIESIMRLGVEAENNITVDKSLLKKLSLENDAVILSCGTWKESGLSLDEIKYQNIIPAISFLRSVVLDKSKDVGKNIIIVGGGNSAIDAARVSIRKGAKVKLLYRRTRTQMPAQKIEIKEALEEGMELFELMSPVEIIPSNKEGLAKAVKFEIMKLSLELDESGRNKIIKTNNYETYEFDNLIYATGQKVDKNFIDAISEFDLKNVHLCGDALNGQSSVIQAVASGRKVAYSLIESIDKNNEYLPHDEMEFYSQRESGRLFRNNFRKQIKPGVKYLDPEIRNKNFDELEFGHSVKTAGVESHRCVNCGCKSTDDCDLRAYSIEYSADPQKYKDNKATGLKITYLDDSCLNFEHEPSKCIKCGKCILVCDEIVGAKALSFIGRGGNVFLSSNTKNKISESTCIECGMCIDSCPTGSLVEKLDKDIKWSGIYEKIDSCDACVANCELKIGYIDGQKIRVRSNTDPICSVARWAFKYDYKDYEKYYKGKVKENKAEIDESRIVDLKFLKNSDYVLSLSYDPISDNPSIYNAFKVLSSKGVEIKNINSALDIPDLKSYLRPIIIFNYFNHDVEMVNLVLKKLEKVKILPVYYRILEKNNNKK